MSVFRSASVWLVGAVLIFLLWAFFAAVTSAQLTSEDTGQRLLRRSVAELTDIDTILPEVEVELKAAAAGQPEGSAVRVPAFPIAVDLPREEALSLSGEALRDRLLDESATAIYSDGMSVWTGDDPEATQNIERISATGAVDTGLGFVRESAHTVFLVLSILLGLLLLALLVILVLFLPRESWLVVLGGVTLISALPSLAAAVALRFAFRTAEADGDPFIEAMMEIGSDATWVPIRNFFTLSLLGAALLLMGTGYLWWEARTAPHGNRLADTHP